MKFLVVFVAVLAVSTAQYNSFGNSFGRQSRRQAFQPAPAPRPVARRASPSPRVSSGSDATATIVRYDSDINPDGSYTYLYETDNGIAAQQQGTIRSLGGNPPEVAVSAQGSYSYTSPEGEPISVSYVADENGYQPSSNVLPVAPPVPPQILRALEYIAKVAPTQRRN